MLKCKEFDCEKSICFLLNKNKTSFLLLSNRLKNMLNKKEVPNQKNKCAIRVYSIGNLQKTKFYMGTPKGESTKTAIS